MGYEVLINQMRSIIHSLPVGKEFSLNDIIKNPPARLGRTLYEDVKNGVIPDVICITTKVDAIQRYRKC